MYLYSNVLTEFEYAVYSFHHAEKLDKQVFFGVLFHTKDTQDFFLMHDFKTVPYLTVSL